MRPEMLSTQLAGVANLALLAPVRAGFVEGSNGYTFTKRLEALLKTLNAMRQVAREQSMVDGVFPDAISKLGLLHSFRYALVPPRVGSRGEEVSQSKTPLNVWRLYLNVVFDGGWEPYIRVIYRDLGPLLDAIFCHVDGYPLSRDCTFDEYTRWVRDHEIPGGLFYTSSAATVRDHDYAREIDRISQSSTAAVFDSARVRFAMQDAPSPRATIDGLLDQAGPATMPALKTALAQQLKALNALHQLRALYPDNAEKDEETLLRFTQLALADLVELCRRAEKVAPRLNGLADPMKSTFDLLLKELEPYKPMTEWAIRPLATPTLPARPALALADVQGGILTPYADVTHGALIFLRVANVANAGSLLAKLPVSPDGGAPISLNALKYHCNVAFTPAGLRALGVDAADIDRFPQEFLEGMEARAGLLGDLRYNHPSRWRRPLGPRGTEIDFGAVHLVVQLRIIDPHDTGTGLHAGVGAFVSQYTPAPDLRVMAIEPMRSYPEAGSGASNITREHFGFQDGFSQPRAGLGPIGPKPAAGWADDVQYGEILLGHPSDRGGGEFPYRPDQLLDNGTFLVIRKIRQHVEVMEGALAGAASQAHPKSEDESAEQYGRRLAGEVDKLKARLMGRTVDGNNPIHPAAPSSNNNYDYSGDREGNLCPFHSHARRANPRTRMPMPRIIRRGMSYGPRKERGASHERGVLFMAYCASIAEQFETIQRWITGGNSSGVASTNSDPFLGVWPAGGNRTFEYMDGTTLRRLDLGGKPFTELQWGIYLFVPRIQWLQGLNAPRKPNKAPGKAKARSGSKQPPPYPPQLEQWRKSIEDPDLEAGKEFWKKIRSAPGGIQSTPYGTLVAAPGAVTRMLSDKTVSVSGYGRRFTASIGMGYLGLDDPSHAQQARGVNPLIAGVSAVDAHALAFAAARAVLARFPSAPLLGDEGRTEATVDLLAFSKGVLAALCEQWFGVRGLDTDDLLAVGRYIFWPHPMPVETDAGKEAGARIINAVKLAVQNNKLPELADGIVAAMRAVGGANAFIAEETLAGIIQGFIPTTHLNFVRVMKHLLEAASSTSPTSKLSLFDLQSDLFADLASKSLDPVSVDSTGARLTSLRKPVLALMRLSPVPELVWRTRLQPKSQAVKDTTVALSLRGAMMDPQADNMLMFGGDYAAPAAPPHACPGYNMAIGVLTGMLGAILTAGTLRPAASPTALTVVKRNQ